MKNIYQILQVDPNAEPEVIQAAYKKLSLKYHPDINKSQDAVRRMQELNEAYRILRNPALREEYDLKRSAPGHGTSDHSTHRIDKKYGKNKTSYEVTICPDGLIDIAICHDNKNTRSFILAHKNNPKSLLIYRNHFSSSYIRAKFYLAEVMSDYLSYFEQNRVRFIVS